MSLAPWIGPSVKAGNPSGSDALLRETSEGGQWILPWFPWLGGAYAAHGCEERGRAGVRRGVHRDGLGRVLRVRPLSCLATYRR